MPRTALENATDIQNLQMWQASQNLRNVKIDLILENQTEQGKQFETALKQFQESINDSKLTMQRLQDKGDYTLKVIYVIGSLLLLTAGTVIGQFIHFHPF